MLRVLISKESKLVVPTDAIFYTTAITRQKTKTLVLFQTQRKWSSIVLLNKNTEFLIQLKIRNAFVCFASIYL